MAGGAIDQPLRLSLIVMQLRAFAEAYRTWKSAKSQANLKRSPMIDMVRTIELEVVRELIAKGKAGVRFT